MSLIKHITVLGVDPGTKHLGYCLMKGYLGKFQQVQILDINVFNSRKTTHEEKLKDIFDFFSNYIKAKKPDIVVIENAFLGKNVQTMLKLGRLQGILFAVGHYLKIPILTLTPGEIKQSVTGKGNASKQQVSFMIKQFFQLNDKLKTDATDAAAVAFTYFIKTKKIIHSPTSNWKKFIEQNPDRIL
ncbi:MAG: crossover junction endodeoxyribonuclease RuvC [Bacteroidales bacterium]|nr:crossover junction endodeoxyribonuclease RuvC [Bacteroidales bacterium]